MFQKELDGWGVINLLHDLAVGKVVTRVSYSSGRVDLDFDDAMISVECHANLECHVAGKYGRVVDVAVSGSGFVLIMEDGTLFIRWHDLGNVGFYVWKRDGKYVLDNRGWRLRFGEIQRLWSRKGFKVKGVW